MRRLLLVLVVLGIVAFLAATAGASVLGTAWGRDWVRERISRAISSGIMGRLEIESIDALSLSSLRARGVRIYAPNGEPAIEVERVKLDFELRDFYEGRYGWRRAEVEGCRVQVLEDARGEINMEQTFKGRPDPKKASSEGEKGQEQGKIELQNMVTSGCTLLIAGGDLPRLRMTDLRGIMRIEVLPDGPTQLRFDDYRGSFVEGLPTGELLFREVTGHVHTDQKQLLAFQGRGKSQGEPVSFTLAIDTKPKKRVKIDAVFPELTKASLRALAVEGFSAFSKTLELNIRHGGKDD